VERRWSWRELAFAVDTEWRDFPLVLERGFALNETPVEKEGSLKAGRRLLKWLLESSLSVGLSFGGT